MLATYNLDRAVLDAELSVQAFFFEGVQEGVHDADSLAKRTKSSSGEERSQPAEGVATNHKLVHVYLCRASPEYLGLSGTLHDSDLVNDACHLVHSDVQLRSAYRLIVVLKRANWNTLAERVLRVDACAIRVVEGEHDVAVGGHVLE